MIAFFYVYFTFIAVYMILFTKVMKRSLSSNYCKNPPGKGIYDTDLFLELGTHILQLSKEICHSHTVIDLG